MNNRINSSAIAPLIKPTYTTQDINAIWQQLTALDTLNFEPTGTGLFPAAAAADADNTGYKNVWVRDNVYVAYAHYLMGEYKVAAGVLSGLMTYFKKFRSRFVAIIDQPDLKEEVMKRPHIRFDGERLEEIEEDWEHAQNDALGYFLWLYCELAIAEETTGLVALNTEEIEVLGLFAQYLEAIRYWEDADSGHWEEGRKVSASSIGVVVRGVKALQKVVKVAGVRADWVEGLAELRSHGQKALDTLLPWESRDNQITREYDAALLFLIYPLNVLTSAQSEIILARVQENLSGEYGIQRYPYDSFWCRDFQALDKSIQTAKYTGRQEWLQAHNREVKRGEEAQWCIFDSIISAIYGRWFQESGNPNHLAMQTSCLNRALGQITGAGNQVLGAESNKVVQIPANRCPELYYLQRDEYSPNVSTPLLWAQANLCIALKRMEQSLAGVLALD